MVGDEHGVELCCRGLRIGAAEVDLLLRDQCSGLGGAIRGLDVSGQPLLPPFVCALEWTTTAR